MDVIGDAGDYRGSKPLFWLYYPDIRGLLANYEVFNPLNDVARYTWDEFFESRQFSSKITKVSNPFGAQAGSGVHSTKTTCLQWNRCMKARMPPTKFSTKNMICGYTKFYG